MSKISIVEDLKQDIKDLEGVFSYEKYGLTQQQAKIQARGIVLNLKDHVEELVKK